MRSVKAVAERVNVGATRIPARAARTQPTIQADLALLNVARPVQGGERAIIHGRPHGDTEPRPVEQKSQSECDGQGDNEDCDIVIGDPDRSNHQCLPGEQWRQRSIYEGIPYPLSDTHH